MTTVSALFQATFSEDDRLATLPQRVVERIEAHENAAEILTRVIQLGIVLFFTILYASSPKLGAPDKQFITPTILVIYVILTTIGLVWSIRTPLPYWAVYGSTIIDMTLLYALIWNFHIIYEQPPSFYLKVPTLLYVFIFIALRALRFQARFVVASGITAAIGWILMFIYVILYDQFDDMITRDFVTYLTSNSILIGAEIDKIICILVVTAILALSIHRARGILIQAISEQDAASNLSRFFDEEVVNEIKGSQEELDSGDCVVRNAAILNVDLRGFSTLAQKLQPHEVIMLLTEYQKRVVPIIQSHGGSIDKFLGDGILASFGALKDSPASCADAMKAIDAILDDYETWSDHPVLAQMAKDALGVSLSYGPVVFGAVGDGKRLEFTVIGSTVNLSAKLEKHNKVMKSRAIFSKQAYDEAERQGFKSTRQVEERQVHVEGVDGELAVIAYFD